MTDPFQHNCAHSESGWCLECVRALGDENSALRKTVHTLTKKMSHVTDPAPGQRLLILLAALLRREPENRVTISYDELLSPKDEECINFVPNQDKMEYEISIGAAIYEMTRLGDDPVKRRNRDEHTRPESPDDAG